MTATNETPHSTAEHAPADRQSGEPQPRSHSLPARMYRRAIIYSSLPLLLEPIRRSNRARGKPLPWTAIWSIAPRFMRNSHRVVTASTYNEHLAMAAHIIGVPAHTQGCVIECGCYKGGSTANLSYISAMVGRELHVFDSFEGLPAPAPGDENVLHHERTTHSYEQGMYAASLEEVRENVRRCGDLSVCHFHEGWFEDTLSELSAPCVAAFVDVDLRSSLETCVQAIWPLLVDGGALFVHEARHHEIATLFFDTEWWEQRIGAPPPGLIGAGTGLGLDPWVGGWGSSLGYAWKSDASDYMSRWG